MKKFRVSAAYSTYCTVEIEAENEAKAAEIAREMDGDNFTPSHELFDWHINEIQEVTQ